MKEIITRPEFEPVIALDDTNERQFEMLEEFVLRSGDSGDPVMKTAIENGTMVIKSLDYVGMVCLNDGSQIEICPRVSTDMSKCRLILIKMLSVHLGIPFDKRAYESCRDNSSFVEYFISLFIRESTNIMKSGMLSGYSSIEENTTSMQGTIIFSENIRRNLSHRERLYVRHDEFTPDRAENRLMKSTADLMAKLSSDHQNVMSLKKLMLSLDEVKLSDNVDRDLSKCINTRNAKKYSVVLELCRLFLANKTHRNFKGRYTTFAMFFPMQELFESYIGSLVKAKHRSSNIILKQKGAFLCSEQKKFPLSPDVAIYEESGRLQCIMNARWSHITSSRQIEQEDILRAYATALKMGCSGAMLIYPRTADVRDMPIGSVYRADGVNIHIIFEPLSEDSEAFVIAEREDDPEEIMENISENTAEQAPEQEPLVSPVEEPSESITVPAEPEKPAAEPVREKAPVKVKLVRRNSN